MKNYLLLLLIPFFIACEQPVQKENNSNTEQIPANALATVKDNAGNSYYFLQYQYKSGEENAGENFCLLYQYNIKEQKNLELVKKGELMGAFQNDGIDCEKLHYDSVNERVYFDVAEFVTSAATYYWDINARKTVKLFDGAFLGVEADGSVMVVYSDAEIETGRFFQTLKVDKNGKILEKIGEKRVLGE